MNYRADILAYLEQQLPSMVELLETLVESESPSSVIASHAEVIELLEQAFRDTGMITRRIRGRDAVQHLYARSSIRKRNGMYQLMIGHFDTVWPLGTLKEMPLVNDGEKLHGPGVYDMKAGLVQMLFALQAIRHFKLEPEVTPVVFINADEEIGSHDSGRTIHRLARRANRAFVLEPSLGPDGFIKTQRKGVGRYKLHVQGKAAHAGLDPEKGASAILELSYQIQKLFELNDQQAGISVNVGMIDGGLRPNVIAPESTAVIDVRVPTHELAERIHREVSALRSHTEGVEVSVEGRIGRPPMEQNAEARKLWEIARKRGQAIGLELEQAAAGGGSDGNTTSQYTPTLDGMGAVGGGAHAHHEFIELNHLTNRTALLALLGPSKRIWHPGAAVALQILGWDERASKPH